MTSNGLTVPQVEVVDAGGKVLPNARVDPAVMSFIMQSVLAAQGARQLAMQQAALPVAVIPLTRDVLAGTILELNCAPPWISATFINKGPGTISFSINSTRVDTFPYGLVPEQTLGVDFKWPLIKKIRFTVVDGPSAVIKIYAVQGRDISDLDLGINIEEPT